MPITDLTSRTSFTTLIKGPKLVLIDFYATWCGPCNAIAPKIEKLANELRTVQFAKINVEGGAKAVAEEYKVTGMPTFIIFAPGGKVLETIVGAQWATLEAAVRKYEKTYSTGAIFTGTGNKLGSEMKVTHATDTQVYIQKAITIANNIKDSILQGENTFFWFAVAYVAYVIAHLKGLGATLTLY